MAVTFKLISTITINSSTATATFTNIPQTYTDLKVIGSVRNSGSGAGQWWRLGFNGLTSGYTDLFLSDAIGVIASNTNGSQPPLVAPFNWSTQTNNLFSNTEVYIPNYTNTSYQKPYGGEGVAENASSDYYSGYWALRNTTTSAITQIDLANQVGNFLQYTTFYLYGIKNS